jgi:hypothetical protein
VFSEIASSGGVLRSEVAGIAQAAIDMERYVGVAVKDTVASFKTLKDDPVKGMFALAESSGLVSTSTIATVRELVKQGKVLEAQKIAVDALREAYAQQAQVGKDSMSPLQQLTQSIANGTNQFLSAIVQVSNNYLVLYGIHSKAKSEGFFDNWGDYKNATLDAAGAVNKLGSALFNVVNFEFSKALADLEAFKNGVVAAKKEIDKVSSNQSIDGNANAKIRAIDNPSVNAELREKQSLQAKYLDQLVAEYKGETEMVKLENEVNRIINKNNEARAAVLSTRESEKQYDKNLLTAQREYIQAGATIRQQGLASVESAYTNQYDKAVELAGKELALRKTLTTDDLALQKSKLDNGIIREGEYQARRQQILASSQTEELAIIDANSAKIEAIFTKQREKSVQNAEAIISNMRALNATKTQEEFIPIQTKGLLAITEVIKAATEKYEAFKQTQLNLKDAVKSFTFKEQADSLNDLQKGLKTAREEMEKFFLAESKLADKAEQERTKNNQLLWASPEKAAEIAAVAKVTERYISILETLYATQKKLANEAGSLQSSIDGQQFTGVQTPELEASLKAVNALQLQAGKDLQTVLATQDLAVRKATIDAATDYEFKQRVELADKVANALANAILNKGKGLGEALRGILQAELSKEITLNIKAEIGDFLNGTNKGSTGLGSILKSALGSFGDQRDDGVGGVTGTAGSGLAGLVQEFMPNLTKGITDVIGQIPGFGTLAAIGIKLGGLADSLISNGFQIGGGVGKALSTIGPLFGAIGGVISGLLNRAFGRKLESTSLSATFDQKGTTGKTSEFFKGGWFSSDKTVDKALDATAQKALEDTRKSILTGVGELAKALNIGTKAFDEFSYSFKIETKGLTPEQIQAKIKEEFVKMAVAAVKTLDLESLGTKVRGFVDSMSGSAEELQAQLGGLLAAQQAITSSGANIKQIIGESIDLDKLVDLKKESETLSETLGKLIASFTVTNLIATLSGKSIADSYGAVGLAGKEARDTLITTAGGLQALTSALDYFLNNFYTEAERKALVFANAQDTVNSGFESVGVAVPKTKEEFRNLVNGIDKTTEAGAKLYAFLLSLAPAYNAQVEGIKASADAIAYYTKNYFTDAEQNAMKVAEAQAAVKEQFTSLGVAVPKNKEEFRALVESIDRTTVAGQKFYAALITMSPAFDEANKSVVATADSISFYLSNFLTDSEQKALEVAKAQYELTKGFGALGLAVPKTKEEFRSLVDTLSKDTTPAGQALLAMVLLLAPAFVTANKSIADVINGLVGITSQGLASIFSNAISNAQSAGEARQIAEKQAEALFKKSLMDTLVNTASDALFKSVIGPITNSLLISSTQAGVAMATGGLQAGVSLASAGAAVAGIVGMVRGMAELFKNPEFVEAMRLFIASMGDVAATLYDAGSTFKTAAETINSGAASVGSILSRVGAILEGFVDKLKTAYAILEKSLNAEKDLLKKRLDFVNSVSNVLTTAIKGLLKSVESTNANSVQTARNFISRAAIDFRNGILPVDAQKAKFLVDFQESITSVIDNVNNSVYGSKFEEDRAKLLLANELQAIEDVVGPQKTAIERQLVVLDEILETAKAQLAAVTAAAGIPVDVVYNLTQAVNNWNGAVVGVVEDWKYFLSYNRDWFAGFFPRLPAPVPTPIVLPTDSVFTSSTAAFSFQPTSANAQAANDDGLTTPVQELRLLREEVVMLRAETRANLEASTNTSAILTRVNQGGVSLNIAQVA